MDNPSESPKSKWYHNLWFILVMLFFVLGPFALPLLWKSPSLPKPVKIILTLLVVGIAFGAIFMIQSSLRSVLNSLSEIP